MKKNIIETVKEHLQEMGKCNVASLETQEVFDTIDELRKEGINCKFVSTDADYIIKI